MRHRARFALASAGVLAIALMGPAAAAGPVAATDGSAATGSAPSDAQVVLSGRVDVPHGSRSGEVVIFHGPARIDGEVEGDVVAFDGPVLVTGLVNGDVVALNGTITVAKTGRITGDAISHEAATLQTGGQVDGQVRGTGTYVSSVGVVGRIVWWVPMTISTIILGLLMLLLFPRAADAIDDAFRDRWVISVAWGVAMFVALPAAAVLITLTLVGIPLGVGILLALLLTLAAGYAWSGWLLGRLILPSRRALAFLLGVGILRLLALIPVAGSIVWGLATVVGLGAASVAIWRARRKTRTSRPVTTPAPIAGSGSGSGSGYDPSAMGRTDDPKL